MAKKPTRAARKAARQQALKPSSSIRVASNAAEIYSDDSENVSIVSYNDEPDYEKEYEEIPSEVNAQMSNDFVSAVNEVEEPEEYEAIEDENIDLADLGRSQVKLSDLVAITSQQAADFGVASSNNEPSGLSGRSVQRYAIFTTTAPTTAATPAPAAAAASGNNQCLTCFGAGNTSADTLAACTASTTYAECNEGDVCMIEMRRRNGQIVDMRTGCKARHACLNLQRINFMGHAPFYTQCRPEDPLTGRRFGASVCRQCFPTCAGGLNCFSDVDGIQTQSGVSLDIVGTNANCQNASNCNVGRSFWDADLLTCAAETTLVTPLTECTNTNYPPQYDGYTAVTHMN